MGQFIHRNHLLKTLKINQNVSVFCNEAIEFINKCAQLPELHMLKCLELNFNMAHSTNPLPLAAVGINTFLNKHRMLNSVKINFTFHKYVDCKRTKDILSSLGDLKIIRSKVNITKWRCSYNFGLTNLSISLNSFHITFWRKHWLKRVESIVFMK